jgi:hypothetical protein
VFWRAKKRMGDGGANGFTIGSGKWRMSLHKTEASANLLSANVSTYGSISFMSSGGGINAEGLTLTNVVWSLSNSTYIFDCDNRTWSPVTSNLSEVRYAVIRQSAGAVTSGFPICYAALSTAEFDVNAASTLTVQIAATGVFTLT